jgi:hypothetical protein
MGSLRYCASLPPVESIRDCVIEKRFGRHAYQAARLAGSTLSWIAAVCRPSHEVRRFYANFTYLDEVAPRRRQGRMASMRALSARWLHRHQHGEARQKCSRLLQQAREQWIKEGKGLIRWTRLSCSSFAANAVRLQLHALAYNLGNFLRTLPTPEPIKD